MATTLWEFASTHYRQPGIAEACLVLQDTADADINMLLTAAWLGTNGHRWQAEDVLALVNACARWRELCLLPLRNIRRNLKELAGAENWYQRIKALELEAERQQLHAIEDAALHLSAVAEIIDSTMAISDNLAIYLATLPAIQTGRHDREVALLTQLLSTADRKLTP